MADLYVSAIEGDDGNAGTSIAAPKATVQSAYGATSTGDRIVLLDPWGDYLEDWGSGYPLFNASKTITVTSYHRDRPARIGGTSGTFGVRVGAANHRFENVDMVTSSASTTTIFGGSGASNFTDVICRNVRFVVQHDVGTSCYAVNFGGTGSHDDHVYEDCEVITNGQDINGFYLQVQDGARLIRCRVVLPRWGSGYALRSGANSTNVFVQGCELDGNYSIYQQETSTSHDFKVMNTKLSGRTYAALFNGTSSGLLFLFMRDVTAVGEGQGIVGAGNNINYDYHNVRSWASNQAIGAPGDGAYAGNTGTIQDSHSSAWGAGVGHAGIVGVGGEGVKVLNHHSSAVRASFAWVAKGDGNQLLRSKLVGGTAQSLLLKGALNWDVFENDVYQAHGGVALDIRNGDSTPVASGLDIRGNRFVVSGSGSSLMAIGALTTQEDGTSVVDYNSYEVLNSATWGTVRGTSVSSLQDVRDAWTGVTTNDDNSYVPTYEALDGRTVSRVTLVDTTTTNTDMRGTDSAYTGTPPTAGAISTQVAADLQTAHGAGSWQTATGFSTHSAADVRAEMDSNSTQLAAIVSDTNELQTDWSNGGRLDTLLDTAASGGGGDATEAKQDQIIGLISSGTITSNSPVDPNTNTVTIIRNATYDGTARPTLAFTVSKDYTGWTGTFTVNHRDTGVELISASVTVTSSTLLNVTLAAADTALTALLDDEEFGRHPYDIQMTSGSSNDVLGPYIAQLVKDVKG